MQVCTGRLRGSRWVTRRRQGCRKRCLEARGETSLDACRLLLERDSLLEVFHRENERKPGPGKSPEHREQLMPLPQNPDPLSLDGIPISICALLQRSCALPDSLLIRSFKHVFFSGRFRRVRPSAP